MLTQRRQFKAVCAGSHFRIYIKLLDCANWKKKIGQFYQTWGNKCWERADGRQDFHVGEFLLAGPVWALVPICPDAPIHFLGPLWCQKMNGLCIWSLVINSWIRSIAWTDMNQGERRGRGGGCFLSSLSHANGSTFFHYSVWILLGFFSPPPKHFNLFIFGLRIPICHCRGDMPLRGWWGLRVQHCRAKKSA